MRNHSQKFDYPNQWTESMNLKKMAKDASVKANINNKRYLEIVQLFILKDHVWKLLKWVNHLEAYQMKVSFLFLLIYLEFEIAQHTL